MFGLNTKSVYITKPIREYEVEKIDEEIQFCLGENSETARYHEEPTYVKGAITIEGNESTLHSLIYLNHDFQKNCPQKLNEESRFCGKHAN